MPGYLARCLTAAALLLPTACAVPATDAGEDPGIGEPDLEEPDLEEPEAGDRAPSKADDPGDGDSIPSSTQIERALDFGMQLVGTSYGWWYSGPLPAGAPMWTVDEPAPSVEVVAEQSANCTGLTNLMLRSIGVPLPDAPGAGKGGTYAYQLYYADVAEPFDVNRAYPAGTLLGRRYRDTFDQGHVAVVLDDGHVLQSFAWERGGSIPGVNATYTVAESHDGGYYEYAVLPEHWLGAD